MLDAKDGGAKSRKLWYALFTTAVIFAGAMLSSTSDSFAAIYDTMVGGVLGALGLYLSGNVGTKWVVKGQGKIPGQPPAEPPVEG